MDPSYRERCAAVIERIGRYFDPEVRGLANLPTRGPYILVGNHSGGAYTPDAPIFAAAFLRHWGMDAPFRPLAHNLLFSVPSLRSFMGRVGALPASPENAADALARGEILMVYPGGDYESQRPIFESKRVDFGGRKGFIRLALQQGVPVIPVVCHGANETVVTLTRGEWLARVTGLSYVTRTKVLPLRLSAFGIVPAFIPHVPLPSKITIEVGHPMAWRHFSPEDAKNSALVDALYDDIMGVMQRTLDGLYRERPNPYAPRVARSVASKHSPWPALPYRALMLRERAVARPYALGQSARARAQAQKGHGGRASSDESRQRLN
jgi:1-acyl-sn-glycerol-3-phosphate acyltransferase